VSDPNKIKPGKGWYWFGALAIVAGGVGAIALFIAGVVSTSRTVDDFARFVAPAEDIPLNFLRDGEYTIYCESESTVDGRPISVDPRVCGTVDLALVGPEGGEVVIRSDNTSFSFSTSGRVGESIAKVRIPSSGTYLMSADSAEPVAIAVGRGQLGRLALFIGGGIAAGLAGLAIGLTVIIVTAVKRGRRKRERRAATAVPAGYPPSPYAPSEPSPYAPPEPSPYAPPPGATPPPAGGGSPPPPPPKPGSGGGGWAPPPPPPPG
jgi:hypothetical protein